MTLKEDVTKYLMGEGYTSKTSQEEIIRLFFTETGKRYTGHIYQWLLNEGAVDLNTFLASKTEEWKNDFSIKMFVEEMCSYTVHRAIEGELMTNWVIQEVKTLVWNHHAINDSILGQGNPIRLEDFRHTLTALRKLSEIAERKDGSLLAHHVYISLAALLVKRFDLSPTDEELWFKLGMERPEPFKRFEEKNEDSKVE